MSAGPIVKTFATAKALPRICHCFFVENSPIGPTWTRRAVQPHREYCVPEPRGRTMSVNTILVIVGAALIIVGLVKEARVAASV